MTAPGNRRAYGVITGAYWSFTLTDGALRMLVLLHFNSLGYSPLQIATLFLLYEVFGMATNLIGGWIGARRGLGLTLCCGLALQLFALVMMALLDESWPPAATVLYVLIAQGISGIAKDFTKMSAKSAVRLLGQAGEQSRLFRWVAMLTGSKNAIKGGGFFLGGLLLAILGYRPALLAMGGLILLAFLASLLLPGGLGKARDKPPLKGLMAKSRAVNRLSLARLFLFGSRDVWFAVGLPIYLYDVMGWQFSGVGGFLALWVIGYGIVQALVPALLGTGKDSAAGNRQTRAARRWVIGLALVPAGLALGLHEGLEPLVFVIGGLAVFGFIFAVNSALHSYLILAWSSRDDTATNVGFYYMANAAGRLLGTILSGVMYQVAGITGCLVASSVMLTLAALVSRRLPGGPQPPR